MCLFPIAGLSYSFNNNQLNPPCKPDSLLAAEGKPVSSGPWEPQHLYSNDLGIVHCYCVESRPMVRSRFDCHLATPSPSPTSGQGEYLSFLFPKTVKIDERGATPWP